MLNFYLADIDNEKYNSSSAIGSLLWTVYFLLTVFSTAVLSFGLLHLLLVPLGDHGIWNFDHFNRAHFEILVVIEVRI